MPLIIVILGICLLLFLILVLKFNSFLSFIIVSLSVAIAVGMPLDKAVKSIENGIGTTMGFLVLILGLGSMLGKLVSEIGAAQRITAKLIKAFGIKHIQMALMLTGFIVGVSLFYDVGFFIMIPLVFTVAASTGLPLLYVGLPMLAALSVTHGYLPPHPAPTAITAIKPNKNIRLPYKPKRCMGFFPNFDKNQSVIKSRYPFTKRSNPNFVSPNSRLRCSTTFSPIFLKPAFFAK